MATYDYPASISTGYINEPQMAKPIRPQPEAPGALSRLAAASSEYAAAAERFIAARADLQDARAAWEQARDIVAKVAEAEAI